MSFGNIPVINDLLKIWVSAFTILKVFRTKPRGFDVSGDEGVGATALYISEVCHQLQLHFADALMMLLP